MFYNEIERGINMSFGISGADPFKPYSSNAEAGGSMGVYVKRKKKNKNEEKDAVKNSLLEEDSDDEDIEIDMDDDFLL